MNPFWLVFFNWVGSTNNQLNHCKNTFSDVGSDPSQELNTMKHLHGLVDDTVSDGTCKVFTYMNAVKTHRSVGKYTIKGSYSVCVCVYTYIMPITSHPGGRNLFQHCCGGDLQRFVNSAAWTYPSVAESAFGPLGISRETDLGTLQEVVMLVPPFAKISGSIFLMICDHSYTYPGVEKEDVIRKSNRMFAVHQGSLRILPYHLGW